MQAVLYNGHKMVVVVLVVVMAVVCMCMGMCVTLYIA